MKNIISLHGEVQFELTNKIVDELFKFYKEGNTEDIILSISSDGGSAVSALHLINVMNFIPNNIITICQSIASSGALWTLAGGTKGKRFSMKNVVCIQHEPVCDMEHIENMTEARDFIKDFDEAISIKMDSFIHKTNLSKEEYNKIFKKSVLMGSEDLLKYGFIDHIVENHQEMQDILDSQ